MDGPKRFFGYFINLYGIFFQSMPVWTVIATGAVLGIGAVFAFNAITHALA